MNKKRGLLEKFSFNGVWDSHTPEGKQCKGKLIYDTGKIKLHTESSLCNGFLVGKSVDIHVGYDEGGNLIILSDFMCNENNYGKSIYRYSAGEMFIINIQEEFRSEVFEKLRKPFEINKLKFSFSDIHNWLDKMVSQNEYSLPSNFKLSSIFEESMINIEEDKNVVEEQSYYLIEKKSKEVFAFDEGLILADRIKALVELLTDNILPYTKIEAIMPIKIYNGEILEIKMDYYGSQVNRNLIKIPIEALHKKNLKSSFQKILNNWFTQYPKIRMVLNDYLGSKRMFNYIENDLLNSIRCLEMISSNYFKPIEEIDAEYSKACEELMEFVNLQIKSKYIDKLENQIFYKEKGTLRVKLNTLFNTLPEKYIEKYIQPFVPKKHNSENNIDFFSRMLVNTRNYYTHGNEKKKCPNCIEDKKTMYNCMRSLDYIIRYSLFKIIDIDEIIRDEKIFEICELSDPFNKESMKRKRSEFITFLKNIKNAELEDLFDRGLR